jgi:putative transposase
MPWQPSRIDLFIPIVVDECACDIYPQWAGTRPSVKEECLSRLILLGEVSLRHALAHYVGHFHHERNHQGKGNVLLFPAVSQDHEREGPVQCRERLGGLLKYYTRKAA